VRLAGCRQRERHAASLWLRLIVSKLKLKGDAVLVVTDTLGNETRVSCLVPPPPK